MSPSRANDLLKGNSSESNSERDEPTTTTPLSLTSVSEKPKATETAPKPAVTTTTASTDAPVTGMFSSAASTAAPKSSIERFASVDNEAQRHFDWKQKANVTERFTDGLVTNLKGQAEGVSEIFFGKRDQTDALRSTLTGEKTGNEHALVNVTKTTLAVGGVVKDLAADTVGLGDGKTSAALSKAISQGVSDFQNGSAGDRASMLGSATGFGLTMFAGMGGTAKGASNLATDVRALRTLVQTEKQTAALSEAVTGMKALRTTERVVAAVDRAVVQNADEIARAGTATTAKTTPVASTSLLTRAGQSLENAWSRLTHSITPSFEPAFALPGGGSAPLSGSRAAQVLGRTEGTTSRIGSFFRSTTDEAANAARPGSIRLGGASEVRVPRIPSSLEPTVPVKPVGTVDDIAARVGGETRPLTTGGGEAARVVKPQTVATHVDDAKAATPVAEATTARTAGRTAAGHVDDAPVVAPEGKSIKTATTTTDDAAALAGKPNVAELPKELPPARQPVAGVADDARPQTVVEEVSPVTAKPVVELPAAQGQVQVRSASASEVTTALESGTRNLVSSGDNISAQATRLAESTVGKTVKTDLDEIARLGKDLGKSGDDIQTLEKINQHLSNISRTAGQDVFDEVARVLKPTVQKAETTVLQNGTLKTVQNIEQRIARISENLSGPQASTISENLQVLQNSTRKLGSTADDAVQIQTQIQTRAAIDTALRNLETAAVKSPVADDVARLAAETRKLQSSVNVSRNFAAIEKNSTVLVNAGDDIAREVGKLAPKAGPKAEADIQAIAALSRNLGKTGDDLKVLRQIDERVANIARNSGTEVADEISRTLKPSLLKAEQAAVQNGTLKASTSLEQRVARLTESMTGPEAAGLRQDLAALQLNTQKLVASADDAAATRGIERAIANIEKASGNTKYADEITRLVDDTRQIQSSVSVSRGLAAMENNSAKLTGSARILGDDALRLSSQPANLAAKADLEEIARLSQNLGRGGDDLATVTRINERVASIGRSAGTEVADDIGRALKPTIQKVEATVAENGALRSSVNLEQRIARAIETVSGPEAAAIKQNLTTLQRSTRNLLGGADDVATHADDVQRALQNLERSAARTGAADDIARIAADTRQLQTSLNSSRRLTALENTTRTLVNDGRSISDEVARISAKPGARAVQEDLDEISRLSRNLGNSSDDLETVRRINERVANIGRTAGRDVADDVALNLAPKVQKAEATAIEISRTRNIAQVTTRVENQAQTLGQVTREIAGTVDVSTTKGRVLNQQLQAIQRAADELPTSLNPAVDAARVRTMVSALDNTAVSATQRQALTLSARNLDDASTELSALRTLGNQTRRIEQGTTALRSTVAQFNDDLTRGTATLKPGTEETVRRALSTIDENSNSIAGKLGSTARVDSEIRGIHSAVAELEKAGQTQLARQISQQVRNLDNANTARMLEVTTHQGPFISQFAHQQTLIARTIESIESDINTLRQFGNVRGTGRLDTITNLQENLTMIRYLAREDARLLAYADDAQRALSRTEMLALSGQGRMFERGSGSLVRLAEAGNEQALNRMFVRGLQSNSWSLRELATNPQTWLNRIGNNAALTARIFTRPETYSILGRMALIDAPMTALGGTLLYANYKYHSQLLLQAIEKQMQQQPETASQELLRTGHGDGTIDDGRQQELHLQNQRERQDAARERRADLDFTPSVAYVTRRVNMSPVAESMAARFGFSQDDPDAEEKIESIIYTGKRRRWEALGGISNVAVEEPRPVVQTAKTIRIKGDGSGADPTNHQKVASTHFNFTRAMALTNQLKLMTAGNDGRGGTGKGAGTVFGGGPSATPSLSQNLRTMVAFGSIRNENGSSQAPVTHRESTEDTGIDQGGGASVPKGPQVQLAHNVTVNTDPTAATVTVTAASTTGFQTVQTEEV